MTRLPTTLLAILFALALASCGDETTEPTLDDPAAAATPISVCGQDGVGFFVSAGGHGLIPFGARVMFELGSFAVIDPSCKFAISSGKGILLGGTLDEAQAEAISRFLALEEWEVLPPEYAGRCASHLGATIFRWGERRLALLPCYQIPEQPDDFRHDLLALRSKLIDRLEPWSEPLDGPMRYVLVDNSEAWEVEDSPRQFANAALWPLGDPDTVAVVPTYDGPLPSVEVATENDAAQVRAIRDASMKGDIGSQHTYFAPIIGPDGRRYELYSRDVAADFEADGALVVPWLTDAGP